MKYGVVVEGQQRVIYHFTKIVVLKSHANVKHNGVKDTTNNLCE